jgi:hypothetical protein
MKRMKVLVIALVCAFSWVDAKAIILYGSGDPEYNTTPPVGEYADSGWRWQGYWFGTQATPIGEHHFIAASHVGGYIGAVFRFRGEEYKVVAFWEEPTGRDLTIFQVDKPFPDWGPTLDQIQRGMGQGIHRPR